MRGSNLALRFSNKKIEIIDQTLLPNNEEWIDITIPKSAVIATEDLKVRGAPLIGVTASLVIGIYCLEVSEKSKRLFWLDQLLNSRPTAVNLIHHLNDLKKMIETDATGHEVFSRAFEFYEQDQLMCKKISEVGSKTILSKISADKLESSFGILTHCNTGSLATAGTGTALAVIKQISSTHKNMMVYVDETRPLLQGARLTAYELHKKKCKFKLICDNAAGFVMSQKKVDAIIVGADRIASSGDTANKIGTYSLAVLAKYHNIPFFIAAPSTTIDSSLKSGHEIPIEERNKDEVLGYRSKTGLIKWGMDEFEVYNPAFDWVPAELITGIITEETCYTSDDFSSGVLSRFQKSGGL